MKARGMTLIELMVTVVVAGIALELAWSTFGMGSREIVHRMKEADSLQTRWLQSRAAWRWRGDVDSVCCLGDSGVFH